MIQNEYTAEEHARLVANINAAFFQRGIGRIEDNPTTDTNYQIAMQLNVSVKTVDKELNTAYKQITNVLSFL